MRNNKTKYLCLSLLLIGGCCSIASCRKDCCSPEVLFPLSAIVWNEDMTETIYSTELSDEENEKNQINGSIKLSLNETYIFETYVYYESSDPDYNYTDAEVSYDDVHLDYDSYYLDITTTRDTTRRNWSSRKASSQCYYLVPKIQTRKTTLFASVTGSKVGQTKLGEGHTFEATLSFLIVE
ncbi:MAG: hypothetical protein LUC31_01630 [Coprobacillus sp.]|nr:hypothetical protein [Coprobacillus sp.]